MVYPMEYISRKPKLITFLVASTSAIPEGTISAALILRINELKMCQNRHGEKTKTKVLFRVQIKVSFIILTSV